MKIYLVMSDIVSNIVATQFTILLFQYTKMFDSLYYSMKGCPNTPPPPQVS